MRREISPECNYKNALPPLIYNSRAMAQALEIAQRAAGTEANVLILGENGTGKELIAHMIHDHSPRRNQAMHSVDLGAISESVFESEMFGHERGAFTNADDARPGRFRAADRGTIFLDEIGNLSINLQAKLLTALEQRKVTPLGSDTPQSVDVRIVAATNCSPTRLADPQYFRTDLLFRLNTVEVHLPPLRERPEDIPPLLNYYLRHFSQCYRRPTKALKSSIVDALQKRAWPGNVRALRHAAERAVILSCGASFCLEDFQLPATSLAIAQRHQQQRLPSINGRDTPFLDDLNLSRLECSAVRTALAKHHYNISHAAKALGITRATLYRRMEKFGL